MKPKYGKQDREGAVTRVRQGVSFEREVLQAIKDAAHAANLNVSAYLNRTFRELLITKQPAAKAKE